MKRRNFLQLMAALAGVGFLPKAAAKPVELPIETRPVPIGSVMPFCGDKLPPGWLPCDGRVISPNHFPELHKLIKELPDMRARIPVRSGASPHQNGGESIFALHYMIKAR